MLLTIPGTLPGLNEVLNTARTNRYKAAVDKRGWTELVAWHCKQAKLPQMQRVALNITWYEKDRRRDIDNITGGGCKYLLDGMVTAGIIPDDGQKYVCSINNTVAVDKQQPRVEVEILEA